MDRVNVDSDDGRRAALDVAAAARDALPPNGRYDDYEVVFVRERGAAGLQMSGRSDANASAPLRQCERPRGEQGRTLRDGGAEG